MGAIGRIMNSAYGVFILYDLFTYLNLLITKINNLQWQAMYFSGIFVSGMFSSAMLSTVSGNFSHHLKKFLCLNRWQRILSKWRFFVRPGPPAVLVAANFKFYSLGPNGCGKHCICRKREILRRPFNDLVCRRHQRHQMLRIEVVLQSVALPNVNNRPVSYYRHWSSIRFQYVTYRPRMALQIFSFTFSILVNRPRAVFGD